MITPTQLEESKRDSWKELIDDPFSLEVLLSGIVSYQARKGSIKPTGGTITVPEEFLRGHISEAREYFEHHGWHVVRVSGNYKDDYKFEIRPVP